MDWWSSKKHLVYAFCSKKLSSHEAVSFSAFSGQKKFFGYELGLFWGFAKINVETTF